MRQVIALVAALTFLCCGSVTAEVTDNDLFAAYCVGVKQALSDSWKAVPSFEQSCRETAARNLGHEITAEELSACMAKMSAAVQALKASSDAEARRFIDYLNARRSSWSTDEYDAVFVAIGRGREERNACSSSIGALLKSCGLSVDTVADDFQTAVQCANEKSVICARVFRCDSPQSPLPY